MADDNDNLDEETLQRKLHEYHAALRSEFEATNVAELAEPEKAEVETREFFKKNVPHAAAQIAWLAQNADSETVKLNASKYVIEKAFKDSEADGDPVTALLKELTAEKSALKSVAKAKRSS